MTPRKTYLFVVAFVCTVGGISAVSQQATQGEKWRQRISMEGGGFSMPARTIEVCVPEGQPEQAVMQQGDSGNCAVSNMRQSGNKTSFDMKCTGEEAVEGHVEFENLGNTYRSTMNATMSGMSMKMTYEGTRLGQACEVRSFAPPPQVQFQALDVCSIRAEQWKDDAEEAGQLEGWATTLLAPQPGQPAGSNCRQHAVFQKFCAVVQTPRGFSTLQSAEWRGPDQESARMQRDMYRQMGDASLLAALDEQERISNAPLTESLKACGLGTDTRSLVALQKRLAPMAEQERRFSWLLYYATDDYYGTLAETAKTQCSGRSFTSAADARYAGLCNTFGAAFASGERPRVLAAAGCRARRADTARGICVGAVDLPGTDDNERFEGGAGAAVAASGGGAATSGSAGDSGDESAVDSAVDKARDAVDRGRRAIRGILGGGRD